MRVQQVSVKMTAYSPLSSEPKTEGSTYKTSIRIRFILNNTTGRLI